MTQHEITLHNRKSVQEVSKQPRLGSAPKQQSPGLRSKDKGHLDYWKQRLFRNSYTLDGVAVECGNLSVKIQHRGRRETFALRSSNREVAAREARDIHAFVTANGMVHAISRFKPEIVRAPESPTVGEFLAAVEAKAGLRPKTFKCYAAALRKIVAEIFEIDGGKTKFDYRSGGRAKWLERIESLRLATLTPERVQAWKVAFVEKSRGNPIELVRAKRNANSFLRQAKSLFSPKATRFLSGINLPNPLPFSGVTFEKAGSMRYQSRIDHRRLVVAAREKLAKDQPEQFKIFLLALGAGLRKAEIDALTWKQIDWDASRIWIGATEHFTPKSEDSYGSVDVDPAVLAELRLHKGSDQSEFVVNSHLPSRPGSSHQYYRCAAHFDRLSGWLRAQGVTAQKPLHELRKEFGSLVCEQAGIFAASTQLRHGDIRVTASFYLDRKQRVTVKLF